MDMKDREKKLNDVELGQRCGKLPPLIEFGKGQLVRQTKSQLRML